MCNPVGMSLRVSIAITMGSLRNTRCGYGHVNYVILISIFQTWIDNKSDSSKGCHPLGPSFDSHPVAPSKGILGEFPNLKVVCQSCLENLILWSTLKDCRGERLHAYVEGQVTAWNITSPHMITGLNQKKRNIDSRSGKLWRTVLEIWGPVIDSLGGILRRGSIPLQISVWVACLLRNRNPKKYWSCVGLFSSLSLHRHNSDTRKMECLHWHTA